MKKHRMQLWIIALLVIAMLIPTATAGAVNATRVYLRENVGDTTNVNGQVFGYTGSGSTLTLYVDLYTSVANATVDEGFTCTSSNKNVATCDIASPDDDGNGEDDGSITITPGDTAGSTTIKVMGTKSKRYATVTVKVGKMATDVTVTLPTDDDDAKIDTITAGSSLQLNWEVEYSEGDPATNKNGSVTFTTDNKNVTVNSRGKVSANTNFTAETKVNITACSSDYARKDDGSRVCGTTQITVKPRVKTLDICLTDDDCPDQISVDLGEENPTTSYALTVKVVEPTEGADDTVKWKSSNKNVATVGEDSGEVTIIATKAGSATITATAQDGSRKSASIKITVGYLVQKIELTNSDANFKNSLTSGKTTKYIAKITSPASPTNKQINWKVVDYECASKARYEDLFSCPASPAATVSSGTVRAKTVDTMTTVMVVACPADGNYKACKNLGLYIYPAVSKITLSADDVAVVSSKIYAIEKTSEGSASSSKTSIEFTAAVEPLDADQTVTWTVSPKTGLNLAVDESDSKSCTVTGSKTGTYTVTAKAGGKSATARVSVAGTLVSGVSIERKSGIEPDEKTQIVTLANSQVVTLKAVITNNADNKNVKWSVVSCEAGQPNADNQEELAKCTKSSYATVSNGKVTARKTTSVVNLYVIAEAADGSGKFGVYPITINPAGSKVSLYYCPRETDSTDSDTATSAQCTEANGTNVTNKTIKENIELNTANGKTIQLFGIVTPSDASQELNWKSNNTKIAGVDADGLVTFYNSGTVTITATTKDGSNRSAKVTITGKILVKTITITGSESVAAGKTIQLKAVVDPNNATTQKLTWKSSNTSIATVNSSGKVTGGKNIRVATPVTITATATDVDERHQTPAQGEYTVIVYPAVTEVHITDSTGEELNNTTIGLDLGPDTSVVTCPGKGCDTYQLSSYTLPDAASSEVTWKSSNTNVAKVDEKGLVTAVTNGTCVIYCTAADGSGKSAKVNINVNKLISSIEIVPPPADEVDDTTEYYGLRAGLSQTVYANIGPYAPKNANLTWVSEDTSIVTVSGAKSYNEKDGINTIGQVTIKAASNVSTKLDSENKACTMIYAKANDGSGIVSEKVQVCVYPAAGSVNIFAEDGSDLTNKTIELEENGASVTIIARAFPDGANQENFTFSASNQYVSVSDQTTCTLDDGTYPCVVLSAVKKGGKGIKIYATTGDGTKKSASVKINTIESTDTASALAFTGISNLSSAASVMAVSEDAVMASSLELDDAAMADSVMALDAAADTAVVTDPYSLSAGTVAQLYFEISPVEAAENEVRCYSSNTDLVTVVDEKECVIQVADEVAETTTVTITGIVQDGSNIAGTQELTLLASAPAVVDEPTEEATVDPEATATEEATVDPEATATEEATVDPEATVTEEATVDPEATATEEATVDPNATATEEATVDPNATATEEATVDPNATATEEATVDPNATATEEATVDPNATATEEVNVEPTATPVPEIPAVSEIKLDVENDTVAMFAGENVTVESWKLTILPENADVSAIEFKIENEAVAKLRYDKLEDIKAYGLIIDSVAAGETKLTIKCGDVEKVIKIIINALPTATPTPEIDYAATEQALAAEQAAAEAAAKAAAEAAAATATAEAEAAAATATAEAEAAEQAEVTVVEGLDDASLS